MSKLYDDKLTRDMAGYMKQHDKDYPKDDVPLEFRGSKTKALKKAKVFNLKLKFK